MTNLPTNGFRMLHPVSNSRDQSWVGWTDVSYFEATTQAKEKKNVEECYNLALDLKREQILSFPLKRDCDLVFF